MRVSYSVKVIRKLLQKIQEEIKNERHKIRHNFYNSNKPLTDFERGFMLGRMAQCKYINSIINNYIEYAYEIGRNISDRDRVRCINYNNRFDILLTKASELNMDPLEYALDNIKFVRVNNRYFECKITKSNDLITILSEDIRFDDLQNWVVSSFDVCNKNKETLIEHVILTHPEYCMGSTFNPHFKSFTIEYYITF